ncbi:MAG: glycosyltransferase [Pseudomonadota bacterium]
MRLLRIIPTLNPAYGGPVAGLLATTKGLTRAGVTTEVVTLDPADAPWLAQAPVRAVGVGPGLLKPGFTMRLNQWIARNAHRFDAAIVHGIWTHASVGGAAALARAGVPYLLYTHGMMDPWFRTAKPIKHWVKQAFWLAQGRALAGAHAVLFTAELERDMARGAFWGPPYRERVVSYGAHVPHVSDAGRRAFQSRLPALGGRSYMLFLSRIHSKKGCDALVRAHARVPGAPDLVLAGPDPDGLVPWLLSQGTQGRVHYAGPLYGEEKGAALAGAEALALISHQENFGVVLAEAMALGTPVLTTDKVNIWPVIQREGAGLIGADTQDGAERLLKRFLSLAPQDRTDMGTSARAAYQRHFTPDGAVAGLVELFDEMTGLTRCAA